MTSWGYIRADRVTLLLDFPAEPLLAVADGAKSFVFGGFLDGQAVLYGLAASGAQVCTVQIPAAHVRAVVQRDNVPVPET